MSIAAATRRSHRDHATDTRDQQNERNDMKNSFDTMKNDTRANGTPMTNPRTTGKRTSELRVERKRATSEEKEERTVKAMEMVIQGKSTTDVKRWFREELGIQFNQSLRYLRFARERLAAEHGLGPDYSLADMKSEHYAIAMKIVATSTDPRARIAALKHAGSIYGVEEARKIEARVVDMPATLPPDEMKAQVLAALARLRSVRGMPPIAKK
jgi:hypothetical protein